ncbi:MAG: hypothetical protein QOE94_4245, partial [Mycobacterium sp.]|nr:hypothetical protein [Mycobacterium sp.]
MITPSTTAPRLPWDPADPYPFYEQRRRDGDVVWDETAQAWLILGYDAAREILGGSGWTSNPLANPNARAALDFMGSDLVDRSMLFADGANHERLRGSVRDVFTRSFITGLTAGVEAIATAVIDHPSTATAFDFMAAIALPLPIAVAPRCRCLGAFHRASSAARQWSRTVSAGAVHHSGGSTRTDSRPV